MDQRKWIFTDEELKGTPNKLEGLSRSEEMRLRYCSALIIQELGEKLNLNQLCINTGIVFMHRFYTKEAFSKFPYKIMSAACLFLAAKIEEQPRKIEHVAKTAHHQIYKDNMPSEARQNGIQDLIAELNEVEQILLSRLGFEMVVEHPHSLIVMTCSVIKASKEISHSSYLFASASLFTTTMCIQYPTTMVACACIMTACRWAGVQIQKTEEGREWFNCVDASISLEKLQALSNELATSVTTYQTKFIKKRPPKVPPKDGQGETAQVRPLAAPSTSGSSSHPSVPRRHDVPPPGSFVDYHNGDKTNAANKHCDNNKPPLQPDVAPDKSLEARRPKPTGRIPGAADVPHKPSNESLPYKLHQVEFPANRPPFAQQSGFTVPLPPEQKPKAENRHSVMTLPEYKKHRIEHQPRSSLPLLPPPHLEPMAKVEVPPKPSASHHPSFHPSEPRPQPMPKQPSFNMTLNTSLPVEPMSKEEPTKEKMDKEYRKDKVRYSEGGDHREKHKKRSKHGKELAEEESPARVLPMKIKLAPILNTNPSEELKLKIKEIPKPDLGDKVDQSQHRPELPTKGRLTVKIGKDSQGNFFQQPKFTIPHQPQPELTNHHADLSMDYHSRKRKSEQPSLSLSKKPRHEESFHGILPIFPPVPPEVPPPLPPQY